MDLFALVRSIRGKREESPFADGLNGARTGRIHTYVTLATCKICGYSVAAQGSGCRECYRPRNAQVERCSHLGNTLESYRGSDDRRRGITHVDYRWTGLRRTNSCHRYPLRLAYWRRNCVVPVHSATTASTLLNREALLTTRQKKTNALGCSPHHDETSLVCHQSYSVS